jgi:hypothetical protein
VSKEYWGTFSVNDHCRDRAFISDVLLYDRLVVPIPEPGKAADWAEKGWQPDRQQELLNILGNRAVPVVWDQRRRQEWARRFDAGRDVGRNTEAWAMQATRTELTHDLPAHVMGVESISAFQSLDELEGELGVRHAGDSADFVLPAGAVTAILAHEFLVPDEPGWSHEDLLKAAVELSSDSGYRRRRANLWRWQWDYVRGDLVVTDRSAIEAAIEEMQDLVEDQRRQSERSKLHLTTKFAFLVGSVTIAAMSAAAAPIALPALATAGAGVFISVGQFVADRLLAPAQSGDEARAGAFLADLQRHFGWDRLLARSATP